MGLTHRDKQQLLQLGALILPTVERSIRGAVEAPRRERIQGLQEQALMADIAEKQRQASTQPQAIPAAGASQVLGFDTAPLAGEQGNLDPKVFGQLANIAAQQQQGAIRQQGQQQKQQQFETTTAQKQQDTVAKQIKDLQTLISKPTDIFAPKEQQQMVADLKQQAFGKLQELQGQQQAAKESQPSANETIKPTGGLDTILEKNKFDEAIARELAMDAKDILDPLKTDAATRNKELKEFEKRGFTPEMVKELIEIYGE